MGTWTHRDLFRLSHPKNVNQAVGSFILKGEVDDDAPEVIQGFSKMQKASSVAEVLTILGDANYKRLPWETIPTQFLKDAQVWKTLFYNGQLQGQAAIRNITRLARIGAFKDMVFTADFAEKLADKETIERTRLHPINFLNALVVHQEGQIVRDKNDRYFGYYNLSDASNRKKDWTTSSKIVEALNEGFYEAFKSVEPANKPTLVAVDVSGSMATWAANGLDLSAAQVAAVTAMTIARTEKYSEIVGFGSQIVDLGITAKTDLSTAMKKVQRSFGATNMSAAVDWAIRNKVNVETFVTITDNEVNRGRKPSQALADYRQRMGIQAKSAVLAVAATEYSVADPSDPAQMDFVGFDSNAPRALADFSAGRI